MKADRPKAFMVCAAEPNRTINDVPPKSQKGEHPMILQERERSRSHQQSRSPVVTQNLDLAQVLEGNEGTYEASFNGVLFRVNCQAGHSIKSIIPIGQRYEWVIRQVPEAEETVSAESGYPRERESR
jgi:hypothetical protein